jgi:uncharacterized protein YggE
MPPAVRQAVITGAIATLLLTVVFALGAPSRQPVVLTLPSATTDTSTFNPGIITSGDATVSKRPDIAFISVGIETRANTAAAAQKELAGQAGGLISRAKRLGIPDKEISTSGYSIGPNYTPAGTIDGYRASEELSLKWHNVDNVGNALDALVQEGGATHINVSFGLADLKAAQAEARVQAIADARSRASAMANAAGVRLGQVLRVSDFTSGGRTPVADFTGAYAAPTQVPVGQLDISVTVEVDFALG